MASTVAAIRALLDAATADELPALAVRYADDSRAGVGAAVHAALARAQRAQDERDRLSRLHTLERELHEQGYRIVAGVDEVGRGSLAGPVSAGAVILPDNAFIPGLNDSKRLSPSRRREIAARIREIAVAVSVAHVAPACIDEIGIAGATTRAMREALASLDVCADYTIVDGLPVHLDRRARFVVSGDHLCAAIAAASVVAKVERDDLMCRLDNDFPGYLLAVNKGYGSPEHMDALRRLGPSPIHRRSFAPCSPSGRF